MVKYILKRIGLSLLILFGVSVILYVLVRLMPVDFVMNKLLASMGSSDSGGTEFERRKAELYAYYGLEEVPTVLGVWKGYWKWLGGFLSGDFGVSFKYGRPVEEVIFRRNLCNLFHFLDFAVDYCNPLGY